MSNSLDDVNYDLKQIQSLLLSAKRHAEKIDGRLNEDDRCHVGKDFIEDLLTAITDAYNMVR